MRYFRRSGPGVLVKDHLERFVAGPVSPSEDYPEGVRGQRIAYDESQENQARYADQAAQVGSGWYEVDENDVPVFPKSEDDDEPAEPAPVPKSRTPWAPTEPAVTTTETSGPATEIQAQ